MNVEKEPDQMPTVLYKLRKSQLLINHKNKENWMNTILQRAEIFFISFKRQVVNINKSAAAEYCLSLIPDGIKD